MRNDDMLARLVGQAEGEGADLTTLRAIVEDASDEGAARALDRLRLGDDTAQDDLIELRQLLAAWREAKRGVWKAVFEWLFRGLLALLLIGIAVRLGLSDLVR